MMQHKQRFTKEEIKAKFDIWLSHRADDDYEYGFESSFDSFFVETDRINRFPVMED